MNLNLKRLNPAAITPTRATDGSAGYDLHCIDGGVLLSGCRVTIPTGWAMEIPAGYYGEIHPRSGLAVRAGIDTLAGVIDCDYRGEVGVVLINHGADKHTFHDGDRVAQIVFKQYAAMDLTEVGEIGASERSGGYGSTGRGK